MKIRRLICLFIAALLLISSATFISAAESDIEKKYITIDFNGVYYYHLVLVDKDKNVFAPTSILTNYGRLRESSSSTDYTFYRKSECTVSNGKNVFRAGARTITIDKKGTGATISCYVSQDNAKTVSTVKFSGQHTVNEKLYLPLIELLPLIDAKTEITKDGVLHIYSNPVSAYDALFRGNLDAFAFELDDVVYGDIVTATSLVIDTVLGFKYDRLMGAVGDYSSLFTKLLTMNETYLKAFDEEETPIDKYLKLINEENGNLKDVTDNVTIVTDTVEYIFSSTKHSTSKEFSDLLEVELNEGIDLIENGIKLMKYADTAARQVDDHRDMLNAVFSKSNTSAGIGAKEVYNLYSGETVSIIKATTNAELRKYLNKLIKKQLSPGDVLKPYEFAFDVVKAVLPDMSKEFNDGAEVYFVDKIANEAYAVAKKYYSNVKFDEASLENQRLSLIMTLVASKYAYTSMYDESHDLIKPIDDWLERLYLAADSVECVSSGYYSSLKTELQASVKHLAIEDVTVKDPDDGNDNETETDNPPEDDPDNATIVASGEFGDNLTWKINDSGTLIISGEGEIPNWECPWFDYRESIQCVVIENGITYIGNEAFCESYSLSTVKIPSSVRIINYSAFNNCFSLASFDVAENNKNYSSRDGVLFNKSQTELVGFPKNKDVSGAYTVPCGVTSIGDSAFCECNLLTRINIPDCVTSIGDGAFYYCESLTNITIPDSVTSIGYRAFSGCTSLTTITIDKNNPIYHSMGNCIIETATKTLVAGCKASVIPADGSVTSIGEGAFSGCDSLTSINIPDSVTSIGNHAFSGCDSLTGITIPDSVTSIGKSVFYDCTSLTSVTIGNSVTSIGDYAFLNCTSLTSITIPDSVTSIGNNAFDAGYSLTSINYCGTKAQWEIIEKGYGWDENTYAAGYTVHCTDGDISK